MSPRKKQTSRPSRAVRSRGLASQLRKEQSPLRKKMLLLGYVTDRLEKKSQTVYLVGGQAVETYTAGQFLTGDIDITTSDRQLTEKILASLGFKQVGMIWLNEDLLIAVQIVGDIPTANYERMRTIEVGPYHVRVIGVEDLIVDRLAAAKFWKSTGDLEKARVLYANFQNQIDLNYLRLTAKKRGVEDIFTKIAQKSKHEDLLSLAGSLSESKHMTQIERIIKKTRKRAVIRQRKSERGSLPKLKSFVREKHDRFD